MSYIPLYDLLPEIAVMETRTIEADKVNAFNVPPGEFGFVEMFCNDEDCDCQRVLFMVVYSVTQKPVAFIYYGWESKQFYTKWFNRGKDIDFSAMSYYDQEAVNYMHGLHFSTTNRQSNYAPAVLEMATKYLLSDNAYVRRLKKHYNLFRAKIDEHYRKQKKQKFPMKKHPWER